MIEAAVIDGCSIYQVVGKIVFPLMTNSIMTVLTLQFMSSWNDLIFSQTMISKTEMQTIPTALIMFNGSYGQVDWGPLFAGNGYCSGSDIGTVYVPEQIYDPRSHCGCDQRDKSYF